MPTPQEIKQAALDAERTQAGAIAADYAARAAAVAPADPDPGAMLIDAAQNAAQTALAAFSHVRVMREGPLWIVRAVLDGREHVAVADEPGAATAHLLAQATQPIPADAD